MDPIPNVEHMRRREAKPSPIADSRPGNIASDIYQVEALRECGPLEQNVEGNKKHSVFSVPGEATMLLLKHTTHFEQLNAIAEEAFNRDARSRKRKAKLAAKTSEPLTPLDPETSDVPGRWVVTQARVEEEARRKGPER